MPCAKYNLQSEGTFETPCRCVDFFAMTYVDWFYFYKKINEIFAFRLAKSIY